MDLPKLKNLRKNASNHKICTYSANNKKDAKKKVAKENIELINRHMISLSKIGETHYNTRVYNVHRNSEAIMLAFRWYRRFSPLNVVIEQKFELNKHHKNSIYHMTIFITW